MKFSTKQRILRPVTLNVCSWNLFHGRDAPPGRGLRSCRSRLTGRPERNATHIQVNRDLLPEFLAILGDSDTPAWEIALLQECPPRWAEPLARRLGAQAHLSLTSRNSLARLRRAIAKRRPDLIASGEGGSNLILIRPSAGRIALRRELTICPGPLPERRTMSLVELHSGICAANLHATNDDPPRASAQLLTAAETAVRWAGERPLIFGGDFNLRPAETPEVFAQLEGRYGLRAPTGPNAIDHILARGLSIPAPPRARPAEERELIEEGLALRLSDHAPVDATFSNYP